MMAKRKRTRADYDERGPTPETRAKLKPDAIDQAFFDGLISQADVSAARQIRDIEDARVFRSVRSAAGRLEFVASTVITRHPLDGMGLEIERMYRDKYIPWEAAGRRAGWMRAVMNFIVDNEPLVKDTPEHTAVKIGLRAWG